MALERWGHITRVNVGNDPVMKRNLQNKEYETGEFGPTWWQLRCDCGHSWRIFEHEFPGRREMLTCGRAECRFAHPEAEQPRRVGRPSSENPSIPKQYYLPLSIVRGMEEMAREDGYPSVSKCVAEILQQGLEARGKRIRESQKSTQEQESEL